MSQTHSISPFLFFYAIMCLCLITLLQISCTTAKSSNDYLGKAEQSYLKTMNSRRASVELYPDKKAITENRTDGVYTVRLTNRYGSDIICTYDSARLKKNARRDMRAVVNVMSHKENYQFIDLVFVSDNRNYAEKNAEGEKVQCTYTVRVPLADTANAWVYSGGNNNDAQADYEKNKLFKKGRP